MDDIAYDIISMYEGHTREEVISAVKKNTARDVTDADIEECYAQVAELADEGSLFRARQLSSPWRASFKERTAGVIKALCLHVRHTCNLNCSYCFASQGKYHGDRAVMSYEVGKQALILSRTLGHEAQSEVDSAASRS